MSRNRSSRRYSRDEMAQILEGASEPASSGSGIAQSSEGFTLGEIQEIAREVGIDPDRVEGVAQALGREGALKPSLSLGTYQAERSFTGSLSEDEMTYLVAEADRLFGVQGGIRRADGYLEWYSEKARAFVGLVAEDGGTRVRVIVDRTSEFIGGGAGFGIFTVLLGLNAAAGLEGGLYAAGLTGVAAVSAAFVAGFWKWRRVMVERRISQLLDLMESQWSSQGR